MFKRDHQNKVLPADCYSFFFFGKLLYSQFIDWTRLSAVGSFSFRI